MATAAHAIIQLNSAHMALSGGEIHVIVAGAASRPRGIVLVVIRLRALLMARGAVANILRPDHRGIVLKRLPKPNNLVSLSGRHTATGFGRLRGPGGNSICDGGPAGSEDVERFAAHAGQVGAHVDLVNVYLSVE